MAGGESSLASMLAVDGCSLQLHRHIDSSCRVARMASACILGLVSNYEHACYAGVRA